jgi:4-hydroxythreonine-4-phosphate dehydrogenase
MQLPRIAITMGDPAGVGPEVCLRLLADDAIARVCAPLVFGDAGILERVSRAANLPLGASAIDLETWRHHPEATTQPTIVHIEALGRYQVEPGVIGAETGRAAYAYIDQAIEAALAGQVAAVTTGPLNKEALHAAGIRFPGHTEIFAQRTGAGRWCMMQYSPAITCTFVTVHVGYREVPALLSTERILDVIELTAAALQRIRGQPPKLVVCGLNPHAGEHGLFGEREEERFIVPAIEVARARGLSVEGPLPPDTAFLPAKRAETDGFVCMYHDQGHIPVKMLAFDSAVNTTLGLPMIRTSVDHGTACDIAWRGIANAGSMLAAVRLAVQLIR